MQSLRYYKETDFSTIFDLYCKTFSKAGFPSDLDLKSLFHPEQVLVLFDTLKLIGFGLFPQLKDLPQSIQDSLTYALKYDKDSIDFLTQHYEKYAKELKMPNNVVVELFSNPFSHKIEVTQDIGIIGAIIVKESYKGRGLGKLLLLEAEKELVKKGSEFAFLDCWDCRFNRSFYESQGYLPIIKLGPSYDDGSALVVMGKELK